VNLRRLFRCVRCCSRTCGLDRAGWYRDGCRAAARAIAAIIGALAAATLFSWLRLAGGVRAVRPLELPLQLGIDIAALTGLLYFTGGWTNPLVSLYLVPIAVASAMLSARSHGPSRSSRF